MIYPNITRPTKDEIKTNSKLLRTFAALFSAKNPEALMDLFHPNGRFLNIPSRATLNGYLFEILQTRVGVVDHFCTQVNYGFTNDFHPGQHVVEFRFMEFDPFRDCPENDPTINLGKGLGEPGDPRLNEIVRVYALTFKDEKIYSLRVPKKFVASIEKFTLEN